MLTVGTIRCVQVNVVLGYDEERPAVFCLTCCVVLVGSESESGAAASSSSRAAICCFGSGDGESLGGGRLGGWPGFCSATRWNHAATATACTQMQLGTLTSLGVRLFSKARTLQTSRARAAAWYLWSWAGGLAVVGFLTGP